jgi:hypothetical protein
MRRGGRVGEISQGRRACSNLCPAPGERGERADRRGYRKEGRDGSW